jgi:uncharacterized membrane-anchored protein
MIKYAFWGATFLIFAAVNGLIAQKEQTIRQGRSVLLAMAPRDPRSLMQGDYMAINYRIVGDVNQQLTPADRARLGRRGSLVLKLDEHGAASFVRLDDSTPLAADEVAMAYRYEGSQVELGVDSFFFQEGEAGEYNRATFAEYKVLGRDAVLVGLRDAQYQRLGK